MVVANDAIVSIDYVLRDEDGQVLDSSEGEGPLEYLHGAGNLVPGLERALEGRAVGEAFSVTLPPEEGYGHREESLVLEVERHRLRGVGEVSPGSMFEVDTEEGPRVVTVAAVEGERVTLDANHPLAGRTLSFEVTVRGVRPATAEEIRHGHPHGEGCCG